MDPQPSPLVRSAAIFTLTSVSASLVCLIAAYASAGWIRNFLIIVAPLVALGCALNAGVRAYRTYRDGGRGRWRIWQVSMVILLMVFLLALSGTYSVLLH